MIQDREIIEKLKNGDGQAISDIMARYERLLWKIVNAVLGKSGSVEDAEECVADVFIELWKEPDRFDPEKGSLKTWLSMRARSLAVDRYRKIKRLEHDTLDALEVEGTDPEAEVIRSEELGILHDALGSLPDIDREIIERRYLDEQSPKEISLALGIDVKKVRNVLFRAKRKLAESTVKKGI